MKAILISIKPQWVAKILSGEKTIEIRKTAPKCDLPIEVYVYCTKSQAGCDNGEVIARVMPLKAALHTIAGRGKVVAKFTLKSVGKIKYHFGYYVMGGWMESHILWESWMSSDELEDYLQASKAHDESKPSPVYGYAWHIDDLVIFNEPKPLSDFGLKRAPQSWQYIEV